MMLLLTTMTSAFAEEEAVGFTLGEIWAHSGFLARTVIVMLVVMLVAALIIAVERFMAFGKSTKLSKQLVENIVPKLVSNDVSGALAMTKSEDYEGAYMAGLLSAGLAELQERQDEHGVHSAHRAVEKAMGIEMAKLKRGMPVLATVGSTAPFVGLFGTTFGVINAFQGMATAGSGLASISAGISEALITTGVGIGVAVVGVWFFNYFNTRTDKVADELAEGEQDFMIWAEKLINDPITSEVAK